MRVPYYIGDPKRDPNLENYPHVEAGPVRVLTPRAERIGLHARISKPLSVSHAISARKSSPTCGIPVPSFLPIQPLLEGRAAAADFVLGLWVKSHRLVF